MNIKISVANFGTQEKAKQLIMNCLAFLLVTPVGLEPTTH